MPRKDKEKTAHKIGMTPVILLFIIIIAAGCTGLKNLKDNLTNIPTNMYGEVQQNLPGNVYGMTRNMAHAPVEGVSILIRGNSSSYSGLTDANGIYNISGVPPGFYDIFAWKEGYRNATLTHMEIIGGDANSWGADIFNFLISRDCLYSSIDTSMSYVLKTGYNGTLYKGAVYAIEPYPEGATYDIYPIADGTLSQVNIIYVAGNRMLEWKLNNSEGRYPVVEGNIYVSMNGTGTVKLYGNKEISITDAASSQPGYLGSETTKNGRVMIDPANEEIKAIAQQVKKETGSEDTWTVARAIFLWLKNNTEYYVGPGSDYTQLPLEVLYSGKGKCDDLSNLYISLLRADGIPARFVIGYRVEKNPEEYVSHRWVEFYDGEWVPVEVSGSGWKLSADADMNFAVQGPDYVTVFIDDGTNDAINNFGMTSYYSDQPAKFTSNIYYDATGYNPVYIAACSDGTRKLVEEEE